MKGLYRAVNRALLALLPVLVGVLLASSYQKAHAYVPGDCPFSYASPSPGHCPTGQTERSEPAGNVCEMSGTQGCCQYQAFNVYCNDTLTFYDLEIAGEPGPGYCLDGTCQAGPSG